MNERKLSRLATFGSPATSSIPRVYDEIGDHDTQLDAGALISGTLDAGGRRTNGGTVLMPAAVRTAPAAAPAPLVFSRPDFVPRSPLAPAAHVHAAAEVEPGPSALLLMIAALGIVMFGIAVAALWARFG